MHTFLYSHMLTHTLTYIPIHITAFLGLTTVKWNQK